MDDSIVIRLRGEGMKPGSVRSHELADILCATEDLIASEALRREPSLRRDDLVIGLHDIGDESVGLRFKTTLAAIAIPAFVAVSQAVASGRFDEISPAALKSLQAISSFSKRHNAVAELKVGLKSPPLAEITPETLIPAEPTITGLTELIARVLRVGGKVPKATLELQDGSVLYCEIEVDNAVELGRRLYETAVFVGRATWSRVSLDLSEFKILEVRDFAGRDPTVVLAELGAVLSSVVGGGDISRFVKALRQSGDAE